MKPKKQPKSFFEMSYAERDEAVKEFDKPISLSKSRPLTAKERASFERMRRGPQRSIYVTKASDGVLVRIEPELLRRSTKYAADHKMTLSEVINRSLKGMLMFVE